MSEATYHNWLPDVVLHDGTVIGTAHPRRVIAALRDGERVWAIDPVGRWSVICDLLDITRAPWLVRDAETGERFYTARFAMEVAG